MSAIPVCPKCGSTDVYADVNAIWDSTHEQWDAGDSSGDETGSCSNCDAEDVTLDWKEENDHVAASVN